MEVTFTKRGRVCAWQALRPPRTVVPGPAMAAGGDVPHDLATFVVERALELNHGFWGCVADGATFRTLGRKRTPQGRAVIERHRDQLDAAERRVNAEYFAWRSGDDGEVAPAVADALDAALHRWRALPDGGSLVFVWDLAPPRRRRNEAHRSR